MKMDSQQDCNITGTEYWIQFTATTSTAHILITQPQSSPVATLTQMSLYENSCNDLNLLESTNIAQEDSSINVDDLNAHQNYYIKIEQSQAVSGYFGLLLAGPLTANVPLSCPPPYCNLVPNGYFVESNINNNLMSYWNIYPNIPYLPIYTYPFSTQITPYSNVCGWGCGGYYLNSPQLKREGTPGNYNYYLYMWMNPPNGYESVYSIINNGQTMNTGDYVLKFKYRSTDYVNGIEFGLLNVPYTPSTPNPFIITNYSITTTANWQQVNIPFTITAGQANLNYLYIRPDGGSYGNYSVIFIDDVEIVPFEMTVNQNPICQGEEVSIDVFTCDENDQYMIGNYQWAASPSDASLTNHPIYGDQTNNQSIYVTPNVTTTYTVTITDNSSNSFINSTVVTVYPTPDVPDISLPTNNTCSGTVKYTITNYNGAYNYSCIINGTSYNIQVNGNGEFDIDWSGAPALIDNRAKVEITAEIPSSGCSNTTEFDVFGCCTGNYDEEWSDDILNSDAIFDNITIGINGVLRIQGNSTIQITNCQSIYFGGDAKIIIESGSHLILEGNTLQSCDGLNMWDGIYIEDVNASLFANINNIYDAKNAVVSQNGGVYHIEINTFDLCYKGIVVEAFNGDHQGYCVTNTFSCSSQINLYPHSGEITQYGVEVNDVIKSTSSGHIDIGDESDPNFINIFEQLSTGIYSNNSEIRIVNNEFNDLGMGIYATGNENTPIANLAREIIIGGNSSSHTNYLNECLNAIDIQKKTHVQIYQNEINGSYAAIQVFNNKYADINIVDNIIEYTTNNGIHVTNVLSDVYIFHNTINWTSNTDIMFGIWMAGNKYTILPSGDYPITNICQNKIKKPMLGIYASDASILTCVDNEIEITTNPSAAFAHGMMINNNHYAKIHYNNVNYGSTPTANDVSRLFGIWFDDNPDISVRENHIFNTGRALRFDNDNSNGEISCNEMNGNYHGVNLNNATIGEYDGGSSYEIGQTNSPHDNTWTTNNLRVYGTTAAVNHIWYWDNSGGSYNPNPININPPPTYSFTTQSTTSSNYCQNNTPSGCNYSPPAPLMAPSPPSSIDREKAIGYAVSLLYPSTSSLSSSTNIQNQLYSNSANYYLVKHTFNRIKEKPVYLSLGNPNDAKYQQFYNYVEQSNIGKFWNVKNYILHDNFNSASSVLNSIIPQNLQETTSKTVYEIYLKYWAKEIFEMSSQDSVILNYEAHENPIYAGEDVYLARNMLGLYLVNLPASFNSRIAGTKASVSDINVYPNPAKTQITLEFKNEVSAGSRFVLYSLEGKMLIDKQLDAGEKIFEINISMLENGVYFYNIINNNCKGKNNKLVIMK